MISYYERVFIMIAFFFKACIFLFMVGCKTGSRKNEKRRVRDSREHAQYDLF